MHVHKLAAFTDTGAGGNPAGVVVASELPSPMRMLQIAAKVGYSETAFAAPTDDGYLVRYFSPESEVPFCGHATIALGAVLGREQGLGTYRLSIANGVIEVDVSERDGAPYAVLRSLPTSHRPPTRAVLDEALALFDYRETDFDPELPPVFANAGAEHLVLSLISRSELARMHYDLAQGREFMRRHGLVTVALVVRDGDRLFHARNAFASGGVIEDPATGAAAAALAGWLRDSGRIRPGRLTVIQGEDLGRRSRLDLQFDGEVGAPVQVGGAASPIEP